MDTKNQDKKCKNCGSSLNRIYFAANMIEEWTWNGNNWECTARNTLIDDPEQNVLCPVCENIIGTGLDFGFGK